MSSFFNPQFMRTIRWIPIFLIILGIAGCQSSSPNGHSTDSISQYPKIDTLLQKLKEHNKFMGALAISKNGTLKYNKAFGYARMNEDDSVKATPATRYRIGSVTKTFTAAIVMQLVEEDELSLDTKLSRFYPGLPNADEITIENLLRHQSGLYNFTDSSYTAWKTESRDKSELLSLFKKHKPVFEPGTQTQYSNTNYVLLGYIIEAVEDQPYRKVLKNRIAKPLSLESTYFARQTRVNPEAGSFRWSDGKWEAVEETNPNIPHAAGALVATPADLVKFFEALFQHEVVSEESLKKMTTLRDRFGMGLIEAPFYERKAYGHTGGIDGFRTHALHFPDDSITVALTANALNYSLNDIMIGVLSAVFDKDYDFPSFNDERVDLSPQQLQRFEGIYETQDLPMSVTIRYRDGQLTGQATGQPAFPLQPVSDTSFKYAPAAVEIKFKKGTFDTFYLHQMGQEFLFTKADK